MTTDILIKVDLIRNGFEESKQNHNSSAIMYFCSYAVIILMYIKRSAIQ